MAYDRPSGTGYVNFAVRVPVRVHVDSPFNNSDTVLEEFALQLCTELSSSKFPSENELIQKGLAEEPLEGIDRGTISDEIRSLALESSKGLAETLLPRLREKFLGSENVEEVKADEV